MVTRPSVWERLGPGGYRHKASGYEVRLTNTDDGLRWLVHQPDGQVVHSLPFAWNACRWVEDQVRDEGVYFLR